MKIIFIEPKSPNLHIFSRFALPRIGSVILATLARDRGHTVKVFVEQCSEVDWDEVAQADLVGISTISSTAPRAYAFADKIRDMNIPVVMGGPHVSNLPKEAVRHADYVLRGEAEVTFLELLEHLQGKRGPDKIHSLARLTEKGYVETKPMSIPTNLDTLPIPDYSLVANFDSAKSFGVKKVIPIQVSRGCPHDCSFCSVTGIFGRKPRYRPVKQVMEELARYNSKKYHIFFYDDHFAGNPQKAKELLREMAKAKFEFYWSTQTRLEAADDPELLQLLKDTRCDTVYVGIESINPESLEQAGKKQELAKISERVKALRQHGISTHGMFILGFDADTPDSWKPTMAFARAADFATVQGLILTPLPGTRTYDEFEENGRILFHDWSMYDCHHVVFKHPTMSSEELQANQLKAHKAFYSWGKVVRELCRGHVADAGIAVYARYLQRQWAKDNKPYSQALRLMAPHPEWEAIVKLRLVARV